MDAYALPLMFVAIVLLIAGGLWFDREPRRPRTANEIKTPAPKPGLQRRSRDPRP